jgi:hypothetical protein
MKKIFLTHALLQQQLKSIYMFYQHQILTVSFRNTVKTPKRNRNHLKLNWPLCICCLSLLMGSTFSRAQEKPKTDLKTTAIYKKNEALIGNQPPQKKQEIKNDMASAVQLSTDYKALRDGEYAVFSTRLAGNKSKKNYQVQKFGNKLYLNGDIVVYDMSVMSTRSYTKDDEEHTFGKDDLYRWPGGLLPVMLEPSVFTGNNYQTIKAALDYFNFNTGIICKERTDEGDYIVIKCVPDDKSGKAGASPVGRQRNGNNILELTDGNFTKGTVMHELMHALGVYHEQGRPDRDDYLSIQWDNIKEDSKFNFQIESDGTIRSGYDYCSIMQYSARAFAKDDLKPTIICKANGIMVACPACIGNRISLTQKDLDGLDKLYAGIGISRFPCNIPFVSSKVPIAGCSGLTDNLIRAKWDYYKDVLGDCVSDASFNGSATMLYAQFEYGVIYHTSIGAFAVYGDIYKLFKAHNGVGNFGFPLNDEAAIKDADKGIGSWQKSGYTRVSRFEKGIIIWGSTKGAKELTNQAFAEGPNPILKQEIKAYITQTPETRKAIIKKN